MRIEMPIFPESGMTQTPCCSTYAHKPPNSSKSDPWFCAGCGQIYTTAELSPKVGV